MRVVAGSFLLPHVHQTISAAIGLFQTQRQTAGVLFVLLVIRLWLLLLLGYALLLFGRLIN
jgi:hypothetical protein